MDATMSEYDNENSKAPFAISIPSETAGLPPRIQNINSESSFTFETELFKGEAQLWINELPNSPLSLFSGKKRKSWFVVQGKFKEKIALDDVLTGQEFRQPLLNLPGELILKAAFRVASVLNPSSTYQLKPHPVFLTNLAATAQVINVSFDESKPSMMEPMEDLRLLGECFSDKKGQPVASLKRKKFLSCERNRKGLYVDVNHTWTFHFWQHLLDLKSYELDLKFSRFCLDTKLNGQLLQLMAKHKNGKFLWNFELLHQNLVACDENRH